MSDRDVYYDDGTVRCVLEFAFGRVFLHLKVSAWSLATLRLLDAHWPHLKAALAEIGYRKIHAFYWKSNVSMLRFAARFGFRFVRERGEFALLECENG